MGYLEVCCLLCKILVGFWDLPGTALWFSSVVVREPTCAGSLFGVCRGLPWGSAHGLAWRELLCASQEPMSAALWGGSLSAEVKLDESCVFTLKSLCGVDLALVLAGLRPSQTCL